MTANRILQAPGWTRLWRILFFCWLFLCLLLGVGLLQIYQQGLNFETDLQALLPPSDSNDLAQQAGQALFDIGGNKIMLVLGSPQRNKTLMAADWLHQQLQQSQLLQAETAAERSQQSSELLDLYQEHRFSLLSTLQRAQLLQGEAPTLADQAQRDLYRPDSWGNWLTPAEDPLNLLPGLVLALQQLPPEVELVGDYLLLPSPQQPDWSYALLVATTGHTTFELNGQRMLVQELDALENQLQQRHPDVSLLRSGIVFHAAAAASQARHEISLIGGGSAIGIVLVFALTFARLQPLLFSLASVVFGSLVALCVCHFLFASLHLLTLVFGASLIGVAVDYSLHYFVRFYGSGSTSAKASLRQVFPGIVLALVTSVIGYASLAQAPLPGLRQVATFSVAGLVGAWLFVVAVYPWLASPRQRTYPDGLLYIAQLPWRCWARIDRSKSFMLAACLGLVALAVCQQKLLSADNVRALYQPDAALQQQDQSVQALAPGFSANQFLLLRAENAEALLQLDERFQTELENLRRNGVIASWNSISQSLPSAAHQRQNYELLEQEVYGDSGVAWPLMSAIGFEAEATSKLKAQFVASAGDWLLPETWLPAASPEQRLLWLYPEQGKASMVTLNGVRELEPLHAAAQRWQGVVFVDRVAQLSGLLNAQRDWAGRLLLLAYGTVMVLLALRYRSPWAALLVVIPLLASLLSLSVLALAAIPVSLFHVFALFLVLGLGMDYSIFTFEARPENSDYQLAILLSAVTSSLSFGLLALSNTPMVQAFGITVLLGSVGNLLLVPLVRLVPVKREWQI
jgi:predicted exporter